VETPIQRLAVSAYTVPTDVPESDGTYAWDSTTLVLVEVMAGNVQGLALRMLTRRQRSSSRTSWCTVRCSWICRVQAWGWCSNTLMPRATPC